MGNPAEIPIGGNPKHKMAMAWRDEEGGHEYTYVHGSMMGGDAHTFLKHDNKTDELVSKLGMNNEGTIAAIETNPRYRRQGHATDLYKFAKGIHEEIPTIPEPKHSESRTKAGNAWAKAQGDTVPPLRGRISAAQFKGTRFD